MCPLCHAPEDNLHVITCNSKIINDKRTLSIDALEEQLLDNLTPKTTFIMITKKLHSWRGNTTNITETTSPSLSSSILAQSLIG